LRVLVLRLYPQIGRFWNHKLAACVEQAICFHCGT
jgi:hypothetical protein